MPRCRGSRPDYTGEVNTERERPASGYDPAVPTSLALAPLWAALLLDSDPCPVVAVVGAGGKTSLIYALGGEAAVLGRRAILTGTTRFTLPQDGPPPRAVVGDECSLPSAVASAFETDAVVVATTGHLPKSRLAGVTSRCVQALAATPGIALVAVHADGSRGRPFKAPGDHEPNIPEAATHVVAVVGLDALGAPIDEAHVHRPGDLLRLVGPASRSDESVIARAMVDVRGGRKQVSGRTFIVVVNKSASDLAAAASLARAILEAGATRVVTTELRDRSAPVRGVFRA